MKILVIGSRIPYPLNDGGAIATYQMLREMAAQGAEITYFTYNTHKHFVDQKTIDDNFAFCRVISYYLNTELKWYQAVGHLITGKNYNISRFFNKESNDELESHLLNNKYDLIHFEGLYATPFLETVERAQPQVPRVLRQHNVEFEIWRKLAGSTKSSLRRWYLNQLTKGLKKYEMETMQKFKTILAISLTDAELLKSLKTKAEIFYYPAGMVVNNAKTSTYNNVNLYHIGSMEWMPNVEALATFVKEIWPALRSNHPGIELHIAGKGLDKSDSQWKLAGIVNHGEVESAENFHLNQGIMIVPLKSGSGIRMKLLEAMSLGKPIIATAVAADGIPYSHQKNLWIANSKADWLSAVAELIKSEELRKSLGLGGKSLVMSEFSVQSHTHKLLDFYRTLAKS